MDELCYFNPYLTVLNRSGHWTRTGYKQFSVNLIAKIIVSLFKSQFLDQVRVSWDLGWFILAK